MNEVIHIVLGLQCEVTSIKDTYQRGETSGRRNSIVPAIRHICGRKGCEGNKWEVLYTLYPINLNLISLHTIKKEVIKQGLHMVNISQEADEPVATHHDIRSRIENLFCKNNLRV